MKVCILLNWTDRRWIDAENRYLETGQSVVSKLNDKAFADMQRAPTLLDSTGWREGGLGVESGRSGAECFLGKGHRSSMGETLFTCLRAVSGSSDHL